ncbi:MAG: tRNA (guanosine(37)-N1)-methyltransferase TrmD [Terriglobia bacterium]
MRFDILTIFPEMFESPLSHSILNRARNEKLVEINCYDLRDFTQGSQRQVDDEPYGGGPGMVMKPEPFFDGVMTITGSDTVGEAKKKCRIVLLSPKGSRFSQVSAQMFSEEDWIVLLCGRYEGVDARVGEYLATDVISIGDYVLSGGEIPAMVVVDAVSRLIHGVVGDARSLESESFVGGSLEYPQYTRPREFSGLAVPDILLSGDHGRIDDWRKKQSVAETSKRRSDPVANAPDETAQDNDGRGRQRATEKEN